MRNNPIVDQQEIQDLLSQFHRWNEILEAKSREETINDRAGAVNNNGVTNEESATTKLLPKRVVLARALGLPGCDFQQNPSTRRQKDYSPKKEELVEECKRRLRIMGLATNRGNRWQYPTSQWTAENLAAWLRKNVTHSEDEVQDLTSLIAVLKTELLEPTIADQDQQLSFHAGNDSIPEADEGHVTRANEATASNFPAVVGTTRPMPPTIAVQNNTPGGALDPVMNSTTASQPSQQATPVVNVGQLKSPPVTPNKDNVPIEKLDRRVLMTRVLGLPGCCLEKGLLRHQELNGWVPTDEMLLDECRRRLGKRGIFLRKVLLKLLKDNPIQDDQECDLSLRWLLDLETEFAQTALQLDDQHPERDLQAPEDDVPIATKMAPFDRAKKDHVRWSFSDLLCSSAEGYHHDDTNRDVHRGQEDDDATSPTVPVSESEPTSSTRGSRTQTEASFDSESMSTTSSAESHGSPLDCTTEPIINSEFASYLSQVDFDGEREPTNIVMMDGTKTTGPPLGCSLEETATTNQPLNDHGAVLGFVPIAGVEDNLDESMSEAARMPEGSSGSTVRSKSSHGKTTRKDGDLVKVFDIDPPGMLRSSKEEVASMEDVSSTTSSFQNMSLSSFGGSSNERSNDGGSLSTNSSTVQSSIGTPSSGEFSSSNGRRLRRSNGG